MSIDVILEKEFEAIQMSLIILVCEKMMHFRMQIDVRSDPRNANYAVWQDLFSSSKTISRSSQLMIKNSKFI